MNNFTTSALTMDHILWAKRLLDATPKPNPVLDVIVSPYATALTQVKFPKRKCHRLRKKYANNPNNYERRPCVYQTLRGVICHPSLEDKLQRMFGGREW